MTGTIEKRLEALETRQSVIDPVVIVRFVTLGGETSDEPGRADVGGRTLLRADSETGHAFLARVEAEAKLAAKPGCVGVALVWPLDADRATRQALGAVQPDAA